jgi:DNA-directed RNA polymerase sigma subunit (sigma70/sigma32)
MVSDADDKRRLAKAIEQGAIEMYRLRAQERLSFVSIAGRTGRSRERVRQILKVYCHLEGLTFPGRFRGH